MAGVQETPQGALRRIEVSVYRISREKLEASPVSGAGPRSEIAPPGAGPGLPAHNLDLSQMLVPVNLLPKKTVSIPSSYASWIRQQMVWQTILHETSLKRATPVLLHRACGNRGKASGEVRGVTNSRNPHT